MLKEWGYGETHRGRAVEAGPTPGVGLSIKTKGFRALGPKHEKQKESKGLSNFRDQTLGKHNETECFLDPRAQKLEKQKDSSCFSNFRVQKLEKHKESTCFPPTFGPRNLKTQGTQIFF